MKRIILLCAFLALTGCASIQDNVSKYWPRDHDPVLFGQLVEVELDINKVNCETSDWSKVLPKVEFISKYTEWRNDPQNDNINGLYNHVIRMNKGANKTFCELGKKTAQSRIEATKNAWKGR
jgi:hypothetical protein